MDLQAEKIIITAIFKNFPSHNILSEEKGAINKNSEYTWVIDPLDGTVNYSHSLPFFSVAICLVKKETPIMSIIFNPCENILYSAIKGKGAYANNKKVSVNKQNDLKKSLVVSHLSSNKIIRQRLIRKINKIFPHILQFYCGSYACLTATDVTSGKLDGYFEIKTNPWDILPEALLVQEAGGKVTQIDGKKITINSTSILATNGKIHNKMLKLLKGI